MSQQNTMDCPDCGGRALVIDTVPKQATIERRRECEKCKKRFTTVEYVTTKVAK